jgi:hypothetical protein
MMVELRNCTLEINDIVHGVSLPPCFVGQPGIYHCHASGMCPPSEAPMCPFLVHPGNDLEAMWDGEKHYFVTGRPIL